MSCLGGRARSWAYGRRLTDPTCFSTYEVFKEELRQAFEPPQNEFRSRAEFLDLQQGKHDVHAYAQRTRYLVSNIVTNPIDEATKVVTFTKGLKDGPVKTYLFREYPSTLESAITLAMQGRMLTVTTYVISVRDLPTYVNGEGPLHHPPLKAALTHSECKERQIEENWETTVALRQRDDQDGHRRQLLRFAGAQPNLQNNGEDAAGDDDGRGDLDDDRDLGQHGDDHGR
ncbi:hypothetical protein PF008_g28584 [Phytophthora fragariae]|uniref:Retrotransposon gag domain-containing protein n=1 Tax=Phytophthora fragariae TaxID=53985 RepID=A0A6G0QBP2_9STRA|nr:hypothetical protein PF008_g28584 [Phytophthora fragariae]